MESNKQSFLRWWILISLQLLFFSIASYFGAFTEIWYADQTKLSFVILSIWGMTTLAIGFWHYKIFKTSIAYLSKIGWFLSEACLALGMIGTVSGFLLMLASTFANIDVTDTTTLQTALSSMALGMSTALYTTLVGLVTSLFIKAQLVNLEHLIDKNEIDDADER